MDLSDYTKACTFGELHEGQQFTRGGILYFRNTNVKQNFNCVTVEIESQVDLLTNQQYRWFDNSVEVFIQDA